MDSCELVTLISTLACALAKELTQEEINILAVILTQLGDTLTTIATNNANNELICENKNRR